MKQVLRTLGIATIIFWTVILAFAVTLVYSAMNIHIKLGDQQVTATNNILTISFPLYINNTGFYDITDLNITTSLTHTNGTSLTFALTVLDSIPHETGTVAFHNVTLNINDVITNSQNLLFNDGVLNFNQIFKLTLARAIPIELSTNQTIPWGAPLYNFTMTGPVYQPSATRNPKATVKISFENHSPYFDMVGTLLIQIYNNQRQLIGNTTKTLNVLSHAYFEDQTEILVDATKVTEEGEVWFYFETTAFSFGPLVIPYD